IVRSSQNSSQRFRTNSLYYSPNPRLWLLLCLVEILNLLGCCDLMLHSRPPTSTAIFPAGWCSCLWCSHWLACAHIGPGPRVRSGMMHSTEDIIRSDPDLI
ncbi:hypothetical protein XENOCAPTIV_011875, partial [Xenoophorus captivus]